MKIILNGNNLTVKQVEKCAKDYTEVELSNQAYGKIKKAREIIDNIVKNHEIVYGLTTGYGPLCNRIISKEHILEQQKKLIYHLTSGVDRHLDVEVIRAIMIARANVLAKGYSGIKRDTLETLIKMINNKIHPFIFSKGSLGASGDLIHLGHLALAIIGEGNVLDQNGNVHKAKDALKKAKINPVKLAAKEGLALVNGTSAMTGMAALIQSDINYLTRLAELTSSFLVETHFGSAEPFNENVHRVRQHNGQKQSAKALLENLKGSECLRGQEILKADKIVEMEYRHEYTVYNSEYYVQDPYSIRCVPQILGSVRDLIDFTGNTITTELNATTDNPIIDVDNGKVFHGGNFYGQQISFAMDIVKMAAIKISILAERQIDRLVNESYNAGLPAMLVKDVGHNSGFAGAQMTATSLVAESRVMSVPASIQSIPSNANNQDVVSMGTISARKNFEILKNLRYILAIEILALCQAADFRGVEKFSDKAKELYNNVRKHVDFFEDDKPLYNDIEKIAGLIKNKTLMDFNE